MSALRMLHAQPSMLTTTHETVCPVLAVALHDGDPLDVGTPAKARNPRLRLLRETGHVSAFRRRPMFKSQLASRYYESDRTFRERYLPLVMPDLLRLGYVPSTRLLTLAMVNIVCDFFGDPE